MFRIIKINFLKNMKDIKTYIIETKQSLINKFINNILSNLNNK